jgi:cyclic beta-1,2-glucan synthetase
VPAALAILAFPALLTLGGVLQGRQGEPLGVFLRARFEALRTNLAQALVRVTFLAYHASEMVHAIVLTLSRLVLTRRRLLEWETAASVASFASGLRGVQGLRTLFVEMIASPIAALVIAALRARAAPHTFGGRPAAADAVGRGARLRVPAEPAGAGHGDRGARRRRARAAAGIARKSWDYFDRFVAPRTTGCLRTTSRRSPGRWWRTVPRPPTSGWRSCRRSPRATWATSASPRSPRGSRRRFATLDRLERHEGHLLNWYDNAHRSSHSCRATVSTWTAETSRAC